MAADRIRLAQPAPSHCSVEEGARFNRWTVLSKESTPTGGEYLWRCRCECGNERLLPATRLRNGRSKSCGCWRRERMASLNLTHGHTSGHESRTYTTWRAMLKRCDDPACNNYEYYGGRGIGVCDRWRDFQNFLADMGERPEGLTIDRIDPDKGYEPGNCRWATWREQALGRRPRRRKVA